MMGMECGQALEVKEQNGAFAVRFIAQCGGRFLAISHVYQLEPRNGLVFADWRAVARELIALTVPYSMRYERGRIVQGVTSDGMYHNLSLTYPLSVKGLADLFGENIEAVRELLADLAVQAE